MFVSWPFFFYLTPTLHLGYFFWHFKIIMHNRTDQYHEVATLSSNLLPPLFKTSVFLFFWALTVFKCLRVFPIIVCSRLQVRKENKTKSNTAEMNRCTFFCSLTSTRFRYFTAWKMSMFPRLPLKEAETDRKKSTVWLWVKVNWLHLHVKCLCVSMFWNVCNKSWTLSLVPFVPFLDQFVFTVAVSCPLMSFPCSPEIKSMPRKARSLQKVSD